MGGVDGYGFTVSDFYPSSRLEGTSACAFMMPFGSEGLMGSALLSDEKVLPARLAPIAQIGGHRAPQIPFGSFRCTELLLAELGATSRLE